MKTKSDDIKRRMSTRSSETLVVNDKDLSTENSEGNSTKIITTKKQCTDRQIFQYEEQEAISRDSHDDVDLFCRTCRNIEVAISDINDLKKSKDGCEEIKEKRIDAVILATNLKKLNRLTQMRGKNAAEKTQAAKSKVDSLHLELQNLLYEVVHIKKEIQQCVNFSSKDEDIDLVDIDTFYKEAPIELSHPEVTKTDAHKQMLARLDWELKRRKQLVEQKNKFLEEKKKIEDEIYSKTNYLNSLKPHLAQIMKTTEPVQELMGVSFETERLMFESAQYLSRPLYLLYVQAKAYRDTCDKVMQVEIEGDINEAKNDLQTETVIIDESDDSDSENVEPSETNSESHRNRKKEGTLNRLEEKRNKLLTPHPLYVRIKWKKKDTYELDMLFKYLPQLNVSCIQVNLNIEGSTSFPLLSSDVILRDLLASDSGNELPSVASKYQLECLGSESFDPYIKLVGYPYLWVQWICGLNNLPNKKLQNTMTDSAINMKHFQTVIKHIRKRIKGRLSLQRQLHLLESLQLPDLNSPCKSFSVLTSWKELTLEEFMSYEKGRALFAMEIVPRDSMYYSATVTREENLDVLVAIHPNYPQEPPVFLLSIQTACIEKRNSLRNLEREINAFTEELVLKCSSDMLLSSMLHKLAVCFDIFVETGEKISSKDRLYIIKLRGRDRNRPYRYQNEGYFIQR
ncbi:THO complex subunit 5 homolog isoform X2 [Hydra vulgaris]|uniref:THO complex subunit 5 homolog isoform X2 n=1 Tax=Hydra vulgaris TaxID=6087 RepID=A0ABM4CND1_HYDVU